MGLGLRNQDQQLVNMLLRSYVELLLNLKMTTVMYLIYHFCAEVEEHNRFAGMAIIGENKGI